MSHFLDRLNYFSNPKENISDAFGVTDGEDRTWEDAYRHPCAHDKCWHEARLRSLASQARARRHQQPEFERTDRVVPCIQKVDAQPFVSALLPNLHFGRRPFDAIPWFPQGSSPPPQPSCYLLERRVAERVHGHFRRFSALG